MSNDIGGFGLVLTIIGSVTFPQGFAVTQFADDGDPFDTPNTDVKNATVGPNGDLISWSKATARLVDINVIPNSDDDANLAALADANRAGVGRFPVNDSITLVALYPDGETVALYGGVITSAPVASSTASSGRKKTKKYSFAFESNS
ncbi:hypothetical protein UFOVP138_57 [uncultured Caudovirales phage]|uniref:Uncharacterized protein n=1 Tax=uncultured Caudovirales phage TaxID=2100421 RepID=A0A6J5LGT1_9CAUD|nr:hypothetical protein UFOVP138_57 [uncultured Caudovirales phage]